MDRTSADPLFQEEFEKIADVACEDISTQMGRCVDPMWQLGNLKERPLITI